MTGRRTISTILVFLALGLLWLPFSCIAATTLNWRSLPELPQVSEDVGQPGVAGPFVGAVEHEGRQVLIVAGGANFPEGLPWETRPDGSAPPKIYHDDVFVLEQSGGDWAWNDNSWKLPFAVGYGANVAWNNEIICIGGEHKDPPVEGRQAFHRHAEVFSMKWNGSEVVFDSDFPPLPQPTTMLVGALVGDVVYVAGGDSGEGPSMNFWSLDLGQRGTTGWNWNSLPAWEGEPRVLALAAGQGDGAKDRFYLFSGRNPGKDSVSLLTDAWSYEPAGMKWKRLADLPRCAMAGTAVPTGNAHVLVIGGAEGELFRKLDYDFPRQIAETRESGNVQRAEALEREKLAILTDHPGFSREVLAYHTVTDTWVPVGEIDGVSPVTTSAVRAGDRILIPSGEMSPGIRTRQVLELTLSRERKFGALNYGVLILYLIGVLINGFWFSRKMKGTEDYFKAGGRIPWWAAGLSIFGTQLSAITFIAIPAKVFATDWRLMVGQFAILIVAPFVILFFLPFYRRLNVTTAYEYLEKRFNVFVRSFGSVMFMFLQFARIGVVLYLPSVALSIVTGMSVDVCILMMGVLCIIYTVSGGMEAVIWTDVTQVIVLAGGALVCLLLIPFQIDGGWNAMVNLADDANKFRLLDFRWEPGSTAFFIVLLGALSSNLISYGTDQAVVQRYLTTPDEKGSARSIWTNAILAIPASFLFFGIGSALFAYYRSHPDRLDPTLSNTESLFPLFIVEQLPAGLAGLVIAGVFAASMSSIDSAMNSVSAAFTTDFFRRFRRQVSDDQALKVARMATVTVGVLGTVFAIAMAHSDVKSIWDQFAFFLGLFGGGLGGVFLLGIFTRRTNGRGAVAGLLGSAFLQFYLIRFTGMNPWFLAFTGMFGCIGIGYLASLFLQEKPRDLKGLTWA